MTILNYDLFDDDNNHFIFKIIKMEITLKKKIDNIIKRPFRSNMIKTLLKFVWQYFLKIFFNLKVFFKEKTNV